MYNEKVVLTGISQGGLMLMLLELFKDGYACIQKHSLNELEKSSIHSLINKSNVVYLADSFNNKVFKFDFKLNTFFESTVGRDPRHMALNDSNLYVTNFESDNISVIDLDSFSLTGSIPAGIKPHDIKYCNNNMLYISCYEENQIIQYSLEDGTKKYFGTDGKPMHIFVSENNLIVMTYFVNGNIYTKINFINIETNEIENVIKIDGLSSDFDYDAKNNILYCLNIEDKSVYIINAIDRKIIKNIYLGGYPESLSIGNNYVYITNSKKNQIAVVDKNSLLVINNIQLDFKPDCIKVIS